MVTSSIKITRSESEDVDETYRPKSVERPNTVTFYTTDDFDNHRDSGFIEGNQLARRFSESIALNSATSQIDEISDVMEIDEDTKKKYVNKAEEKMKELLRTEKTYVLKNLKEIVEGYYQVMEESKQDPESSNIPQDLIRGKDKIIFANVRDIYDFHYK